MNRRLLRIAALAMTLAALTACGGAPEPTADTPAPAPPATPTPSPTPEPTPEPAPGVSVPARFQGEWNQVLADCGTGNNESRLRVAADRVAFYEAAGPVVQATEEGNDLQVTVQLTGEGVTVEKRYAWRLAEDGQALTDLGSGLVRLRCAAG